MYFGQLLGMADHLSFSLGRAGFRAHKILPYGPVPETLQYLLRRAQENSDFGGGCAKEARPPSDTVLQDSGLRELVASVRARAAYTPCCLTSARTPAARDCSGAR